MMKHFKKLTFVATASLLFLLTITDKTENCCPLPSANITTEEDEPEYPIQPLADDEEEINVEQKRL